MVAGRELDDAYLERVYAGVLGKLVGVYLGRPVEGWSREHIVEAFGVVDHYVHDEVGVPLVVPDDDIAGTFTFLRALPDAGYPQPLTPGHVGRTWLDRLVYGHSVLWWGGRGVSTEHTAYLNLEAGIEAPDSGSARRNGTVVAEQIGAQIFVEGWAMICPGDPAEAAELAEAAARVSHDGAAVQAARFVAAMEAAAFDTADPVEIMMTGLRFVDADGSVARLSADLLRWRAEMSDWRAARDLLDRDWGYHRYGGGCHVLPNLGVVLLALLWGGTDLTRTLMIAVTCGWDTDCNAGTVGALVALARGLAAFDGGPDWRGPVADRLYLSTSDGGRAVTDALREARAVVDIARARLGEGPLRPPHAPRFDFAVPGAVQGFISTGGTLDNVAVPGGRALRVRAEAAAPGSGGQPHLTVRADTAVFLPPGPPAPTSYTLLASPSLYPGQVIRARVQAPRGTEVQLLLGVYDEADSVRDLPGPTARPDGEVVELVWRVPDLGGFPIATIGVRAVADPVAGSLSDASVPAGFLVHSLGWTGPAEAVLSQPTGGSRWRDAWLHALDHPAPEAFGDSRPGFDLTQDRGHGLVTTGCGDWTDLRLRAVVRAHSAAEFGIAVRVAGLRRYLALLVTPAGDVRLVRRVHEETVLAHAEARITLDRPIELVLAVTGPRIRAWIDGEPVADVTDITGMDDRLPAGAVGVLVTEGTVTVEHVEVGPAA